MNDYTDMEKTTRTFLENFEGFSQILKEQSEEKMYLSVFTHPIAIIKKNCKCLYLRKNLLAHVVVDYAYTRFTNFAIKYLRENEKVRETVFACSYWATSNLLSKKGYDLKRSQSGSTSSLLPPNKQNLNIVHYVKK